jgi:MFS family permease
MWQKQKQNQILVNLLKYREACFFAGLAIWISISFSSEQYPGDWLYFGRTLIAAVITLAPVMLFVLIRPWLRNGLSRRWYLLVWVAFFGIVLPLAGYRWSESRPGGYPGWFFITCILCSVLLELLLALNHYYREKIARSKWMQRLTLEKAILLILVVLCVMLAAMAVSSMDDPAYQKKDNLLIGFVFSPSQLVRHFGLFISLVLQFLLMYMAGYIFLLINSRILVSVILKKYGLIIYLCSVFTIVAVLYPVIAQCLALLPVKDLLGAIFPSNPFAAENALAAISIMLLSLPVLLSQQWAKQHNQIISLEKEKAQAELDLLKQQVNPHFLFNTLNNLYALSLYHSDKTPESILQLSDLMRYVIYNGNEEHVKLEDELKYIEDFMDLQQIRLRHKPEIKFEKNIEDPRLQVPPMLLIVFVENAFKHGIEPAMEPAFIHLKIDVKGKILYFRCVNSVEEGEKQVAGIGLTNLAKRLGILYQGKYTLHTEAKNHTFNAELQIDLS